MRLDEILKSFEVHRAALLIRPSLPNDNSASRNLLGLQMSDRLNHSFHSFVWLNEAEGADYRPLSVDTKLSSQRLTGFSGEIIPNLYPVRDHFDRFRSRAISDRLKTVFV
jgi:hypothetical protein